MNDKYSTSATWHLGALLFLAGIIGLGYSFSMDTTVPAGESRRVHNIGLLQERQNYLMLSGGSAALGVVVIILADLSSKKERK